MKTLIYLVWGKNGELAKNPLPVELGDKAAELLLKKNKGKQFPEYIDEKDAPKYNFEVQVEDVKPNAKAAKAETTAKATPKAGGRRGIASKAEVEAAKAENTDGNEGEDNTDGNDPE